MTATAPVIRAVPAVVITWGIIRAVSSAAVVVAWLGLTRGSPAQRREVHAGSDQSGEAHYGLPPCQCARFSVVH